MELKELERELKAVTYIYLTPVPLRNYRNTMVLWWLGIEMGFINQHVHVQLRTIFFVLI